MRLSIRSKFLNTVQAAIVLEELKVWNSERLFCALSGRHDPAQINAAQTPSYKECGPTKRMKWNLF